MKPNTKPKNVPPLVPVVMSPIGPQNPMSKRRVGGQKNNTNAKKHGLFPLRRALAERGIAGLEGKDHEEIQRLRKQIYRYFGGVRKLGPLNQQRVRRLLEISAEANRVYGYIAALPSPVNKRSRRLVACVPEWLQLLAAEHKLASDLEAMRPQGTTQDPLALIQAHSAEVSARFRADILRHAEALEAEKNNAGETEE